MNSAYRSWLCSSPFRGNLLQRTIKCNADICIFDLEDSVPNNLKATARTELVAQMSLPHEKRYALRINALSTRNGLLDMMLLADNDFDVDIIHLPKVESAGEIRMLSHLLNEMGRKVEIFAVIETLAGLKAIDEISGVGGQLRGLILGAADISSEIGIPVNNKGRMLGQIKYQIAVAALRHGLEAIDAPCFAIEDAAALQEELDIALDLGFTGKIAIHPSQVAAINHAFSPSEAELRDAIAVVRSVDSATHGIASVQGQMIGPPFAKYAQKVIQKAGLTTEQARQ
ncbi:(S)-citramalyl-CoA lyase [Duganella sp. CF458]|uniref:HpcH/HpaI aldolase/citrate lyase family protein n=1 Tax=Duganella sp. CF458 TaxID=1884368 RepID=UPI0008F275BF|nr:CoA ester lyase [Duganella sp. CF458]SFG10209.1 (S)-citramalyl-CoA lyase [Duganella sp. CF458]